MDKQIPSNFKYGAHMYLWAEVWSDSQLPLLSHVRNLGFELFEVSLGDESKFSTKLLRETASDLGLELTIGPGGVWPMECDISDDDPKNRALGLDWHRRMINLASESGASAYCGAMYGHPGRVLKRKPSVDEYNCIADGLRLLCEYAGQAKVALVIEPMSRFRTYLVNTPSQALELVRMVDSPNLKINLDTYHMVTEVRDYGAAIVSTAPHLWGLHACENDRGVPGGGIVPWASVFDALVTAAPDMRLMLETYNTSIGTRAVNSNIFQDLCPDPDQFAKTGLEFLKQSTEDAAKRRQSASI